MGVFDGILGGVIGAGATTLLNNFIEQQGGLQNVVSQFEKNGFGETMKSWVSHGQEFADHGGSDSSGARLRHGEGTGHQDGPSRRQSRRNAGATSAAGHRQGDPRRQTPVVTPLTLTGV